jgi:hypothetical protein
MDPAVIAALIGLVGVALGAVLREVLPGSVPVAWLSGKPRGNRIVGKWRSSWGPLPEGPARFSEEVTFTHQRGDRLEGHITRQEEPNKKWAIQGRYDGQFLQLYYFPAADAKDNDFLDYGCYFFRRQADGSFRGYSTGFGAFEDRPGEGITTDFHELRRA